MTESGFIPPPTLAFLSEGLVAAVRRRSRMLAMLSGVDPDNRPTISVKVPLDQEWIEARAKFAHQWQTLLELGLEQGYLEDHDAGPVLTDHTTHYESRPNPDYDPNKPNPFTTTGEHVIFRRNA